MLLKFLGSVLGLFASRIASIITRILAVGRQSWKAPRSAKCGLFVLIINSLQVEYRGATRGRCCGKLSLIRAAPLWSEESALRVRRSSVISAMLPPKRFLNLTYDSCPLPQRLPIPEQNKSLAANAATEFRISVRALAKDLHCSSSCATGIAPIHAYTLVTIANKQQR
jgi:hypothetical protein